MEKKEVKKYAKPDYFPVYLPREYDMVLKRAALAAGLKVNRLVIKVLTEAGIIK
jgi:hypothetical protein